MAGSKDRFVYLTDILDASDERKYLVLELDESNSELVGATHYTAAAVTGLTAAGAADYIRLEPRYILVQGATTGGKTVRRRIVCPNPENSLWVSGGTVSMSVQIGPATNETVVFRVTGMVGEKRSVAQAGAVDTGLDDGDQE